MRVILRFLALIFCLITIPGCFSFTRTIYVPDGQAVRLRQKVKAVKVWVKTSAGETVAGKMDLHEGWYCLPLREDEKGVK